MDIQSFNDLLLITINGAPAAIIFPLCLLAAFAIGGAIASIGDMQKSKLPMIVKNSYIEGFFDGVAWGEYPYFKKSSFKKKEELAHRSYSCSIANLNLKDIDK